MPPLALCSGATTLCSSTSTALQTLTAITSASLLQIFITSRLPKTTATQPPTTSTSAVVITLNSNTGLILTTSISGGNEPSDCFKS